MAPVYDGRPYDELYTSRPGTLDGGASIAALSALDELQKGWQVDATSTVPPFEQLRLRILDLTGSGRLAVGTRLPPVRALATALGLAANTVARAYRELEQAGVLATRGRAGTVVAAGSDVALSEAAAAAAEYAAVGHRLGVPAGTALDLVRAAVGPPSPPARGRKA